MLSTEIPSNAASSVSLAEKTIPECIAPNSKSIKNGGQTKRVCNNSLV